MTSINSKHGPFDAVIALGDLFNDDDDEDTRNVVAGTLTLPVPTYFMQGQRELPGVVRDKVDRDAGQVSENLSFLGACISLSLSFAEHPMISPKGATCVARMHTPPPEDPNTLDMRVSERSARAHARVSEESDPSATSAVKDSHQRGRWDLS